MWDCLFALVLFQNDVELIMFRLDAVLIRGNHFRHNAHKAAIILVNCMPFIHLFLLLMLYFLVLQLF